MRQHIVVESYTIYEWRAMSANASSIYNLLSSEKFMRLTGADEVVYDFNVGGVFSLQFRGRGEISGIIEEIIPYHRITLDWNVNGFNRPDENHTKVVILIGTVNGTTVSIEHSGVENEESAEAKRKSWKEILEEMNKLL